MTYRSVGFVQNNGHTRSHILNAALDRFAACGYAGTSVADIVGAARVTKPTLYYYFRNKARLYQALVDSAHNGRFRLMQEAVKRGTTLEEQLVEILTAIFDHARGHRALMRMTFATAFAAPDEVPREVDCGRACERNFEFIHSLIKRGLKQGALDRRFASKELAFGIHGLMNIYLMAYVLMPECRLDRATAVRIVDLFLAGASGKNSRPRAGKTQPKKSSSKTNLLK